jgi:putative DNA primase/helicase
MPTILKNKIKPVKLTLVENLSASIETDEKPGVIIEFPDNPVPLTEDDIAEDFALKYEGTLRFDHHVGKWFVWTGFYWKVNETGMAFDHARRLCRAHRGTSSKMSSKKAAEGVEHMARRDPRFAVTSEIWDRDPFLLGTPGGTVDLRTGELKPANPTDYITKVVAVSPAPKGTPFPVFQKFLTEATSGNLDLQRFLQQWAGYCLTGDTREQALVFIYGTGGNGKGKFINALTEIVAHYAKVAAMDTFVATRNQRHLTELAMLKGARLVTASETEQGQRWSESRINQLTGNDPITANFMRQDHFTYVPQFKLLLIGNHKPKLGSVNEAARRRFNIVPFVHKPPVPDNTLEAKLREEYPAILRWMIDGCLDWQENGLVRPEIVKETTSEYFEEQDVLGQWLQAKCDCGPGKKESATALYESFKEFAQANGEDWGSATTFGTTLSERGFKKKKSSGSVYSGIALKPLNMLDLSSKL